MSSLTVYHQSSPAEPDKVLTHLEDIAATLAEVGVAFARRQVEASIQAGAGQKEALAACQVQLAALQKEQGGADAEVISLTQDHPQLDELRAGLLAERQAVADELYWFVAGRGLLSLHCGDFVYALRCEKHDLLRLPAGTRHWLDIGDLPQLAVIRLFQAAARPTGDDIASRFPRLED